MQIRSISFSLEEIARDSEIVLIDTSIRDEDDENLAERLYDCHEKLLIDEENLIGRINFISNIISELKRYRNIQTVDPVIGEIEDYVYNILNEVISHHQRHIDSRKFKGKHLWSGKRKKGFFSSQYLNIHNSDMIKGRWAPKKGKTHKYEQVELEEEIGLDYLKIYAKKYIELIHILEDRTVDVSNNELLETVKAMANEGGLKRDFIYRYNGFRRKNHIARDTDERIVVAAHELAQDGKDVAVVSDDSDFGRMFDYLYLKRIFKLPLKGHVALYSDYHAEGSYKLRFDTILLLSGFRK